MTLRLGGNTFNFPNIIEFLYIYIDLFVFHTYRIPVQSKTPRILDCGAHIGMASMYFKKIYPTAVITCFEPNPNALTYLRKNLSQNDITDVEVVPAAVWNTDASISFAHSTWSWGDHVDTSTSHRTFEVPTVRLGKYLNQRIDILKMDIESAEETVLKDCGSQLKHVQALMLEYHCNFSSMPNDLDTILDVLHKNNFTVKLGVLGSFLYQLKKRFHLKMPFVMIIHAYQK